MIAASDRKNMDIITLLFLKFKPLIWLKWFLTDYTNWGFIAFSALFLSIEGLDEIPKPWLPFATAVIVGITIYKHLIEAKGKKIENQLKQEELREIKLKNDREELEIEKLKQKI